MGQGTAGGRTPGPLRTTYCTRGLGGGDRSEPARSQGGGGAEGADADADAGRRRPTQTDADADSTREE
jgi:hypothetical protein